MCGLMNFLNISNPPMIEKWKVVKETINGKTHLLEEDHDDDNKQERYDEDEVFDLMTMRRLVKMERQRAHDAFLELEKERMSSTTASEEALAMILRLQNQLSVLEMEAQQHRRLTHEKQLHDQEVIQSLRWIVMKHESERSILEDRLRLCKQRLLMLHVNDGGDDANLRINRSLYCLDTLDEVLVSSLDLGLSQCHRVPLSEIAAGNEVFCPKVKGFENSVESVWDFQFFQVEAGQLHKGTRGSTLAMVNAGLVYWEIWKKDEGVRTYKRAVELNDPAGQCNLGISYLQGRLDRVIDGYIFVYMFSQDSRKNTIIIGSQNVKGTKAPPSNMPQTVYMNHRNPNGGPKLEWRCLMIVVSLASKAVNFCSRDPSLENFPQFFVSTEAENQVEKVD
nr:protein floury 1-like [Tanacetum cinerariifolium]